MKKIFFNDTTVRDIFLNLRPDSINIKNFDVIFNLLNELEFDSIEVWGGASFEKLLSVGFNKSPWDVLYHLKTKLDKRRLQALIGARNLVGYEVYPKDIISKFIKLSVKNGIDIFRVYDALNDIENMKDCISMVLESGADCQGTVVYDPFKEDAYYVDYMGKLKDMGCQNLCVKDVESVLKPDRAEHLFQALSVLDSQIYLSAKNLRGLQTVNYVKAIAAGCSGLDISIMPDLSSQFDAPAIFSLFLAISDLDYELKIPYEKIYDFYLTVKDLLLSYVDKSQSNPSVIISPSNMSLVPKWLILNIEKHLNEINAADKLDVVLEEVIKIKEEVGNPSLSTPIGQILGSQAILNAIVANSRWEITSDEIVRLVKGYFGKLPGPVSEEVLSLVKESAIDLETAERDLFLECQREISRYAASDEDILSYCFFPEKTLSFFEQKDMMKSKPLNGIKKKAKEKLTDEELKILNKEELKEMEEDMEKTRELSEIDLAKIKEIMDLLEKSNLNEIKIEFGGIKISLQKSKSIVMEAPQQREAAPAETICQPKAVEKEAEPQEDLLEIRSPIVGTFYHAPSPGAPPFVKEGGIVKPQDTLCIIEAMKLMNKINADHKATVVKIHVENEQAVEFDQLLMTIKPI